MSKASEWAKKRRNADEAKDFSWQRVRAVDDERPKFVLQEPTNYSRAMLLTVHESGGLSFEDMDIPRERAIAAAHWILETFGDDASQ